MKISNILITLIILFFAACNSNNNDTDHGHEHNTEDNDHSHDNDSNHKEQEEFIISDDSANSKSNEMGNGNGELSKDFLSNQENQITLVVPANKGIEYKFYIKQYEKLIYEWSADAPLYFDFHGEPLDYDVTKYFESYTIATADEMKGTMTIPFEGSHGWYWKNNSNKDVVVILKAEGKYKVIGLK